MRSTQANGFSNLGKRNYDSSTHCEEVTKKEELNFYLSVEKYLDLRLSSEKKSHGLRPNPVEGLSRKNLSRDFTHVSLVDNSSNQGLKRGNPLDFQLLDSNFSRVSEDSPLMIEKSFLTLIFLPFL